MPPDSLSIFMCGCPAPNKGFRALQAGLRYVRYKVRAGRCARAASLLLLLINAHRASRFPASSHDVGIAREEVVHRPFPSSYRIGSLKRAGYIGFGRKYGFSR